MPTVILPATFLLTNVEMILDDTLARRSGKKVALAGMHHDRLLSTPGRPFCSGCHVFVVLAIHVYLPLPGTMGRALPVR